MGKRQTGYEEGASRLIENRAGLRHKKGQGKRKNEKSKTGPKKKKKCAGRKSQNDKPRGAGGRGKLSNRIEKNEGEPVAQKYIKRGKKKRIAGKDKKQGGGKINGKAGTTAKEKT